jgi:hypothetical protein
MGEFAYMLGSGSIHTRSGTATQKKRLTDGGGQWFWSSSGMDHLSKITETTKGGRDEGRWRTRTRDPALPGL